MTTKQELIDSFVAMSELGRVPYRPCSLQTDEGEFRMNGVTYRQWLIGQLLLGAAPPIWESRFDNERVADSIVSLVDAIIKRERQP